MSDEFAPDFVRTRNFLDKAEAIGFNSVCISIKTYRWLMDEIEFLRRGRDEEKWVKPERLEER